MDNEMWNVYKYQIEHRISQLKLLIVWEPAKQQANSLNLTACCLHVVTYPHFSHLTTFAS